MPMMKRKIKGRDGAVREINGDYVLRDGEIQMVDLPFMDGRTMIHDGRGHPVG